MFGNRNLDSETKDLEKKRDQLVDEIKNLESLLERKKIDGKTYKEKRRDIERSIVEVMDRLAQMRFLSGQT